MIVLSCIYEPFKFSFNTINERGFYHFLMRDAPEMIAGLVHGTAGTSPSLQQKVSRHIEVGEGKVSNIGWRHFRNVTLVLIGGLLAASIALLVEYLQFKVEKRLERKEIRARRFRREKQRCRHFRLNVSKRTQSIQSMLPYPD